jgi:hypothetical protein
MKAAEAMGYPLSREQRKRPVLALVSGQIGEFVSHRDSAAKLSSARADNAPTSG